MTFSGLSFANRDEGVKYFSNILLNKYEKKFNDRNPHSIPLSLIPKVEYIKKASRKLKLECFNKFDKQKRSDSTEKQVNS